MFVLNSSTVLKMRPSVALVYTASVLEMFKTNIRESIRLKINNENIIEILLLFNGERPLHEILGIANIQDTMKESFLSLLKYLVEKNILIHIDIPYRTEWLDSYARVLLMIEEYYTSTSRVAHAFNNLQRSVVFIAGLGTVGTWVAKSLAMSGVKKFILVDPDIVDMSNLHRQELFFESDIGLLKVDVASERLSEIDSSIVIEKVNESLDSSFFERHNLKLFDLAINCADNPTVDETSRIVGKFCMANKIPHIIGGGYNLHLTLVGQSVIPFQTACVMCFENALKKLNDLELFDVKKLYRPNRKIGSFGPLCAVTASITATEAFKILIGATEYLAMINKRKEFRLQNMDFYEQEILPNPNCEWCGSHGIFVKSE